MVVADGLRPLIPHFHMVKKPFPRNVSTWESTCMREAFYLIVVLDIAQLLPYDAHTHYPSKLHVNSCTGPCTPTRVT